MRTHLLRVATVFVITSTLLASCSRQINSDVYTAHHVGEASTTYAGFIKSVRQVVVQEGDRLEENQTGIVSGGVLGAGTGSVIGRGNLAAAAGGAVVGAIAGSLIEKKIKEQVALEYVVQLENGELMTVVQGTDQVFQIGQAVYVVVGQFGRSRIVTQN